MARKILDDEGKIDDQSEIYNKKRKKKKEKEIFKNLTPAQKWQYYKDYHLKDTIIVLAILALLFISFKDSFTKDKVVLSIAIEDSVYTEEQIEKAEKKIHDKLGLPEDKLVKIDAGYKSDAYNMKTKLQTYLQAGTVDILISEEEAMKWYSETGYFMEPDTYDEVKFYEDFDDKYRFYDIFKTGEAIRGEEEQSDETYNYGLYIEDSDVYKSFGGLFKNKQVIAININSVNIDYASAAVKYMMGELYE